MLREADANPYTNNSPASPSFLLNSTHSDIYVNAEQMFKGI